MNIFFMMKKFLLYLSTFLLLLPLLCRAESLSINSPDGNEILVERFSATGNTLFIWLPHESSPAAIDSKLSKQIARLGIEVWQLDLFNTNFLPVAASSMEMIPPQQISALIDAAFQKTGKKIFLFTSGRGAVPMLRGARHWQQNSSNNNLSGVILLSPKLFIETPEPGLEGQLMPIVRASNLPIYILQSALSPWFWKLPELTHNLEQGGSDVYIQRLDKVRDRFYFRPDAIEVEHQLASELPTLLKQAARLLHKLPSRQRRPVTISITQPKAMPGKKSLQLRPYQGHPVPPELKLPGLDDRITDLNDLKGQVVLVNFWASWCPPCVHEMPSMARLVEHFNNKPFTILAVNMAEDKQTIQHFINTKVKINFPVVLDQDGAALRRWKVFAFPTSYLLDRQGVIRYAVFGSIDWASPEIVSTIRSLIEETK